MDAANPEDVYERRVRKALASVDGLRKKGDGFAAFDRAVRALRSSPRSLALLHRAVVLAARIGAFGEAKYWLERSNLAQRLAAGESDPLVPVEDLLVLWPRLKKDLAEEAADGDKPQLRREAAGAYLAVHQRTSGHYPLINAATLLQLAGDASGAADLARRTLHLIAGHADAPGPQERFWRALSALEASLILGDLEQARRHAGDVAGSPHGDLSDLGTAMRQLSRLTASKSIAFDLASALGISDVLHYAGHIVAAPGVGGRFPADQETEIVRAIDAYFETNRIGWAFGSLAAGAEILVAERALARGIPIHIVLPFPAPEFVEISVRSAGPGWIKRFDRCRRRAATFRSLTDGGYFEDHNLFRLCSRYIFGLTLLQAQKFGAGIRQLLVWDGQPGANVAAGMASDRALGRSHGIAATVIPVRPSCGIASDKSADSEGHGRSLARPARAMVFGDVVGYSKIAEEILPRFSAEVMTALAKSIERLPTRPRSAETWGDAIFLVYDQVDDAAAAAIALVRTMDAVDRDRLRLPKRLNLRLSGHFGPVFDIENPFTGRPGFLGTQITRAARIEPVTPPGVIYVSEAFAAEIALSRPGRHRTEYVGVTKLAKKFGDLPVFRLV